MMHGQKNIKFLSRVPICIGLMMARK